MERAAIAALFLCTKKRRRPGNTKPPSKLRLPKKTIEY
tara:strand:- start:4538 stop:4651 length:114 start_codon:yes stop_codon:yes gene_type:complete